MWIVAAVGGALSVLSGALPLDSAGQALGRLAPVLVFLVAVTILAELAQLAGVFEAAAGLAAKAAGGRVRMLFLLVVVIAAATTVLLSLDTTAVLLTPVVLALCTRLDLDPLPFAMATVWLANTASLLLPVSNLTNLLAVSRLDLGTLEFAAAMAAPWAVAVTGTTALLFLLYRRRLRGRYDLPAPQPVPDRVLFGVCAASCAGFAVLVLAEVNVTTAAVAAAVAPLAGFALRWRTRLRWSLAPWRLVVLVSGLYLLVAAGHRHGLDEALAGVAGSGSGPVDLTRVAAVAAGGANLVNNLPAYLALEPVAADTRDRLLALLVGVDTGPLILLWGSLATLLWRERCRAGGVRVSAVRFALTGLLLVPVVLVPAALVLGVR